MYYDYQGSRFKQVFTKLQVLNLTEFDKVLMLDLDMLVRRNIDELFDLRAPAALKRPGGREQPAHGQSFNGRLFWRWRRLQGGEARIHSDCGHWRYDMCSGINAGAMLFRPDQAVYRRMLAEIQDESHLGHVAAYGPEQEYLGCFYSVFGPGWTHMDSRFNYQPMLGGCANQFMRELDATAQVAITHFSGPRVKPWRVIQSKGGQREALTSSGVQLLLDEADDAFRERFPENPELPPTGGEGYGAWGYPTLVVALVREWTAALRGVNQQLRDQHGTHLVDVIRSVDRRNSRVTGHYVWSRLKQLCRLRTVRLVIAGGLVLAVRRAIRSRGMRLLRHTGKRLALVGRSLA